MTIRSARRRPPCATIPSCTVSASTTWASSETADGRAPRANSSSLRRRISRSSGVTWNAADVTISSGNGVYCGWRVDDVERRDRRPVRFGDRRGTSDRVPRELGEVNRTQNTLDSHHGRLHRQFERREAVARAPRRQRSRSGLTGATSVPRGKRQKRAAWLGRNRRAVRRPRKFAHSPRNSSRLDSCDPPLAPA